MKNRIKYLVIFMILILAMSACTLPEYSCTIKLDLTDGSGTDGYTYQFLTGDKLFVVMDAADTYSVLYEAGYDTIIDDVSNNEVGTTFMDLNYESSIKRDWVVRYLDETDNPKGEFTLSAKNDQYTFEADKVYIITSTGITVE